MDPSILSTRAGVCSRMLLLLVPVMLLSLASPVAAQERTWTDTSGQFQIEAELVEVVDSEDGLQAQLKRANGQVMTILLSQLRESDAALVTEFYNKANAPEDEEMSPPSEAGEAGETTDASEATDPKDDPKEVAEPADDPPTALPEEEVTTRPLEAPIEIASKKLDNRNTSDVKFDEETAISLEREILRDQRGRPKENPIYTVEVTDRDLRLLPARYLAVTDVLRDPDAPIDKKRLAAESLRKSWPQGRHPGLLKVLVNILSHKDKFLRLTALDLLANHDSDESLIYIFARIDDVSFDVRWRTFEILTQLRDPRVIPELVERLGGSDATKAAGVLQVFGSTSAPLVRETWVKSDGKERSMLVVCSLLGNIGEIDDAETLKVLESHESLLVRLQAKNSIKQIRRRIEERLSEEVEQR